MNGTTVIILIVVVMLLLLQQRLGGAKADEVRAALQQGGRIIDVRTREEFVGGHIKTALHIPLNELANRLPVDVPDKNTPLLLHCASGARSAVGKRTAEGLGYRTVLNVGSYGRAVKLTASP